MNGPAVTINGNLWLSQAAAESDGLSITTDDNLQSPNISITVNPTADTDTSSMLKKCVWSRGDVNIQQILQNGQYEIYLWMIENHQDNYHSIDVIMEGVSVATGIGLLEYSKWERYGPYTVTVADGVLNIDLSADIGGKIAAGVGEKGTLFHDGYIEFFITGI